MPRADVDPVYFDAPYHVYPDGPVATEAFRVIAAALVETAMAGIGRITLSRRERMVMVEPRGAGMVLMTLRLADQVRAAQFEDAGEPVDAEMVAIATMIIKRKAGAFDPTTFRDRYQEALQALVEAKLMGLPIKPKAVPAPRPAADLMAALKRSLAEFEAPASRKRASADRRQTSLLLPVMGGRKAEAEAEGETKPPARAADRTSKRRNA